MKNTGLFWWIDRWRKSSAFMDMTLEQQGAYRNLLDEAHLRGGALPNDERILAKACGDALAWTRVQTVVMARFKLHPDGWRNETLDRIIAKTAQLSEERSRAGQSGNRKRWSNNAANTVAKPVANASSPDPDPDPSLISGSVTGSVLNTNNGIDRGEAAAFKGGKAVPSAPLRPFSTAPNNVGYKMILRLAHQVLEKKNGHKGTGSDDCEDVKALCAKHQIPYNAEQVRKALDSAEVQRKASR